MPILTNIGSLSTCAANEDDEPLTNAAIVWRSGKIEWVGKADAIPASFAGEVKHDAGGVCVIPGLVDSHTHLVFAGWRADEWQRKLAGESYLDIAKSGGGILSTVRATREASEDALVERGAGFLSAMLDLGVTTVEIKSGYGLNVDDELKQLRAVHRLSETSKQRLVPTLLAAHMIPPEWRQDREGYVSLIEREIIPAVVSEGLAKNFDIFVEKGAFTLHEARHLFAHASKAGLKLKMHADQITSCGGAELAAEFGALSADHLECISDAGIAALAESGTVAMSLPLASLYLDQAPMPARRLIEAGVEVGVATDFNPGSAPSFHLPWAMTLACNMQRMTPHEVLCGATRIAAKALGIEDQTGSIEVGKAADFVVLNAADVNSWLYHAVPNAVKEVWCGGERVIPSSARRE